LHFSSSEPHLLTSSRMSPRFRYSLDMVFWAPGLAKGVPFLSTSGPPPAAVPPLADVPPAEVPPADVPPTEAPPVDEVVPAELVPPPMDELPAPEVVPPLLEVVPACEVEPAVALLEPPLPPPEVQLAPTHAGAPSLDEEQLAS